MRSFTANHRLEEVKVLAVEKASSSESVPQSSGQEEAVRNLSSIHCRRCSAFFVPMAIFLSLITLLRFCYVYFPLLNRLWIPVSHLFVFCYYINQIVNSLYLLHFDGPVALLSDWAFSFCDDYLNCFLTYKSPFLLLTHI